MILCFKKEFKKDRGMGFKIDVSYGDLEFEDEIFIIFFYKFMKFFKKLKGVKKGIFCKFKILRKK